MLRIISQENIPKFKKGDEVVCLSRGYGKVSEVDIDNNYPIIVRFNENSTASYTLTGYYASSNYMPSLYTVEEFERGITIGPKVEEVTSTVPMDQMKPLEVGRIVSGNSNFIGRLVMRTASSFTTEIMVLDNPSKDNCWTTPISSLIMVELLPPGEKIILEVYNKVYESLKDQGLSKE